MITIKLLELHRHRNETTFRPLLYLKDQFDEIGVRFVNEGHADMSFIGQASILDKTLTSLIGSYEVFKESNARNLFKCSLLKDRSLYKKAWMNGRVFWGEGDYRCDDFDEYSDRILLSGFNWLNTYGYDSHVYPFNINREVDVCALFGISSENYEHKMRTDLLYNEPRHKILDIVSTLRCRCVTSKKLGKLPMDQYHNTLANSKICISPYGYGEIAIRDVEAMKFGCIVIKPDMDHWDGMPNFYHKDKTYISCNPDMSDLEEKIDYVMSNYDELYPLMYQNIKDMIVKEFDKSATIKYYHDFFTSQPEVGITS
jgi:hypothetical protein